jgi:hypothetical protein
MQVPPRPQVELSAQCLCGAVSVVVKGRVRAMFMCSCIDCQRATGTGHSTAALFRNRDVAITGETRSFSRPADSGTTFTRWFCPHCGTPIIARSGRAETLAIVPVGLFGGAADWFAPNQLIFARSHHDWDQIAAGLPRHQTYRDAEGST